MVAPFTRITGRACFLGLDNVDTDQLCPARFMKRRRSEGYGDALLHDLRFGEDGAPRPNPVDAQQGAVILVAGRNFGGGSSREAAVYAVRDGGFCVVIAASFGDIFAANAARNGLLPAVLADAGLAALRTLLEADPRAPIDVDLTGQTIRASGACHAFAIDEARRTMLLNGWDDVDITEKHSDAIAAFTARDAIARPWAQQVVLHPLPAAPGPAKLAGGESG